jgi:hypothetical protein
MSGGIVKAAVLGAGLAVVVLWRAYLRSQPITDDQRWSELQHIAHVQRLLGRCHLEPLQSHYRKRYLASEKALLVSGYLVEINVPVSNARTRCAQIIGTITNRSLPHTASLVLDLPRDAVRIICRAQGVPLW